MGMLLSKIRRKKGRSTSMRSLNSKIQLLFQLTFNAPDWATVHEETVEKWRKDHELFGFPRLKICSKRSSEESRWNTVSCFCVNHDKSAATMSCVCHEDDTLSFNYDSRDLIKDFMQHADVIGVIPSSNVSMVPVCFKLQNDGMKFIYVLAEDPADNIFFFLNKEGQYDVSQLELSSDDSRISLMLAKRTTGTGEQQQQQDIQYIVSVYERRPQAYSKDFQGNMFDMGHEIPGFYPWNNAPCLLFDRRYYSSRILIANIRRIQTKEISNYIAAYNFTKRTLLFAQKEGIFVGADECDLKNVTMSLDGNYVAAVICTKAGNKTIGLKPGKSVVFFDPDKLVAVSILHIGIENINCCFLADMPAFSKNSRKLAMRHKKGVKIIQMPFPPTLQSLCRSVFIEYMSADLHMLNIPQKIKDYIEYKPYM